VKKQTLSKQLLAVAIGLALTSPSNAADYVYDDLNRLIKVIYHSGKPLNYNYDAGGNLLSITTTDLPQFDIEGHVRDTEGNPLSGVLIEANGYTAETDNDGYYQFTNLPAGDYTLIAELEKHNFTPKDIIVNDESVLVVDMVSDGLTSCLLYAVHDEGRRDTQFFTVNPAQNFEVKLLGKLHFQKDIEALDIDPKTNQIFAAAGDDGTPPGYLYKVNARTGDLFPVGKTNFKEINGLSFKPDDSSLWGWAEGEGLISIETQTGHGTLQIAYDGPVEDITWDNLGVILYAVEKKKLLAYNSQTNELTQLNCTLPGGEVEALEMLPDERLLFSIHNNKTLSLHALDIESCSLVGIHISTQVDGMELNDVEGMAWPVEACSR
jgi:YD repeat-containing protein